MLTVREVAEQLRLDPETIRLRIKRGELPAVKIGNGRTSPYRISQDALDEYVKQQAVTPVAS